MDAGGNLYYVDDKVKFPEITKEARRFAEKVESISENMAVISGDEFEKMAKTEKESRVKELLKGRGRNNPCACGSGKKFKKCCLTKLV